MLKLDCAAWLDDGPLTAVSDAAEEQKTQTLRIIVIITIIVEMPGFY